MTYRLGQCFLIVKFMNMFSKTCQVISLRGYLPYWLQIIYLVGKGERKSEIDHDEICVLWANMGVSGEQIMVIWKTMVTRVMVIFSLAKMKQIMHLQ